MRSFRILLFFLTSVPNYVDASRDLRESQRSLTTTATGLIPPFHTSGTYNSFGVTTDHTNGTYAATNADCSASWNAWLSSSTSFFENYNYSDYTTYYSTYTYHNITAQVITPCDGHPRVVGGAGALTTIATGTNSTLKSSSTPLNFTSPTPTCKLAHHACSSLTNKYGYASPCMSTTSRDCGGCSIQGGTVQLMYFPVTANESFTLCPTASPGTPTLCPLAPTTAPYTMSPFGFNPCPYATPNFTSTRNSGPYIVTNGQTFYRNRAYISLETAYASNKCGLVGSQYSGTILTLKSSDVYSVGGCIHETQDVGYRVNFEDFASVPAEAYYMGCYGCGIPDCTYTGTRYKYGTDFINGNSAVDFALINGYAADQYYTSDQWIWQDAYAPTLLLPLQIRQLDPAWSTCSLDLLGMYDPPKSITQQLTYPTPTIPSPLKTTPAEPASTVTSKSAPITAEPSITSLRSSSTEAPSTAATYGPASVASSHQIAPGSTSDQSNSPQESLSPSASSSASVNPPHNSVASPVGNPSMEPSTSAVDSPVSTAPPYNSPTGTTDAQPNSAQQSQESTDSSPSVGGVIASVLGISDRTTTTDALSVLESAESAFAPAHSTAEPEPVSASGVTYISSLDPSGETTIIGSVPTNNPSSGTTYGDPSTAEPGPASASKGAFTLSIDSSGSTFIVGPSPTDNPSPGATHGDPSQAESKPASASKGAFTLSLDPSESTTIVRPSLTDNPSLGTTNEAPSTLLSDPVTFTVKGQTHTIEAVPSSTGLYIIDGSRTVTQDGPATTLSGAVISAGSSGMVMAGSQSFVVSAESSAASSGVTTTGSIAATSSGRPSDTSLSGSTRNPNAPTAPSKSTASIPKVVTASHSTSKATTADRTVDSSLPSLVTSTTSSGASGQLLGTMSDQALWFIVLAVVLSCLRW